jgi:hypothetical protein
MGVVSERLSAASRYSHLSFVVWWNIKLTGVGKKCEEKEGIKLKKMEKMIFFLSKNLPEK